MFSGEIGSLQPRTSYAVARTIGSREMAQHSSGTITGMRGGWDAAHKAEGKPFSLTFRIYVAKEATQKCEWTPLAVEKVN